MRRLVATLGLTLVLLALPVASALAVGDHDAGQGTYGDANDKVVTNFGFAVIAFFPLFIATMSLLQWSLEKRKDAKKAADLKSRIGW